MLISKTFHNFCSVCAIQVTILQFPSIFSLTSLASTKRNFFNPLAGARMRNPFFGKVRLKDFLQLKGANLLEKRNPRKPRGIQVTMLVHPAFM